jgi:phage/plasmid-associated DNA primase
MLGTCRTGKSSFGHICTALVGKEGSVVTNLKSLNKDPFEVYNFNDMLLLIIFDNEHYKGDLALLKQVVSRDP